MQGLSPRDKPSEPRWDWPWGWQHLRLSPSIPHPGRGQGDPQGKHVNGRLGDLALQPPPPPGSWLALTSLGLSFAIIKWRLSQSAYLFGFGGKRESCWASCPPPHYNGRDGCIRS